MYIGIGIGIAAKRDRLPRWRVGLVSKRTAETAVTQLRSGSPECGYHLALDAMMPEND